MSLPSSPEPAQPHEPTASETPDPAEESPSAPPGAETVSSPPGTAEPESAAPAPARRGVPSNRTIKKWLTVATAALTVIGGIWTVYEIKTELTRDKSNFSSLMLSAQPYPVTATEWALPLATDFSSFPASNGVCGEEQQVWLQERGLRVTTRVVLDMRNTASEGPMLVVKEIGVAGERRPSDDVRILVVCDSAPSAATVLRSARLDATREDGVAVLSAATFGAVSDGLPDTPVAWNLAPGETGQLVIRLSGSQQVSGTLVATVLSGTSARIVLVDHGSVTLRPLLDSGLTYLDAGQNLRCLREQANELTSCVLEEVLNQSQD